MSEAARLPSAVEASGLVRKVQAAGDFAAILKRGDPERGALLLVVSSRGRHIACLERVLDLDAGYRWNRTGPDESASSDDLRDFLGKRRRFDADLWLIELDVAQPERFIAETTGSG